MSVMSTTYENFVLYFQDFLSEIQAILDNNSNFYQHFYKFIILVVIIIWNMFLDPSQFQAPFNQCNQ